MNRKTGFGFWRAVVVLVFVVSAVIGAEDRTYYQNNIASGKTKREAIRSLKRRISDRIWTHLQPPKPHPRFDWSCPVLWTSARGSTSLPTVDPFVAHDGDQPTAPGAPGTNSPSGRAIMPPRRS